MQYSFNPIDFGFQWIIDENGQDWYEFDRKTAQSLALKARNAKAKELEQHGMRVHKWSSPNQLITRGGIGSGKPEISVVITVYGLNAND